MDQFSLAIRVIEIEDYGLFWMLNLVTHRQKEEKLFARMKNFENIL